MEFYSSCGILWIFSIKKRPLQEMFLHIINLRAIFYLLLSMYTESIDCQRQRKRIVKFSNTMSKIFYSNGPY
jgi:hypothetical protein